MQTEQLNNIISKTNQKGNTIAKGRRCFCRVFLRQKMSTLIQNLKKKFK